MPTEDCRLVLDQAFTHAVETVLDAFLSEGFRITPVDGGNLRRSLAEGEPQRFAQLDAALPELRFPCRDAGMSLPAILSCQLSVFELTESCTLVTIHNPLTRYPLLAALVPRLSDRLGGALRSVAHHSARLEAA